MGSARFRYHDTVPPGGKWFYTVPVTNRYFESLSSLRELARAVLGHLAVNKLPTPSIEDISAEIEQHMCSRLPKGFCSDPNVGIPGIDFFSILRATELLTKRTLLPGEAFFVPAHEAHRRAAICAGCSKNLRHVCTSCNGLRDTFAKMVSNRNTNLDSQLGICEACGCGLTAKVHIDRKHLRSSPEEQAVLPVFCWMKDKTQDV